jgi:hypothetical protein
MTEIDTDKLVPTSTDMLANVIANTEKIVAENDRWHFVKGQHTSKRKNVDSDDDLDVEAEEYYRNSEKKSGNHDDSFNNSQKNVFKKPDDKHSNSEKTGRETTTDTETNTAQDNSGNDTKNLSKKELMLLKLDMLRKLGELKQCGVLLSQNYNMESDLDMMQYEYKLHHDIRSKQNSVQWMSHMMIGIVKGTEILNDNYNPFDIKLDGLSDKIGSDMHNYYAVLGDIYEKYNQPGKQMAPELRLLLMISGAALSLQINRYAPGVGDIGNIIRNEDNLKELRQKAEADSTMMHKTNEYMKKQHDAAAQKAADIKMLQEKDLENQRFHKLLDGKNTNMKKIKESLILSSESQSRYNRPNNNINRPNVRQIENDNHNRESDEDEDEVPNLTREEIENIQKSKYMAEQKHIESLRNIAWQKSEMFRNNNNNNEKNKRDLAKLDRQLDNIIETVDNNTEKIKQRVTKNLSGKNTHSSNTTRVTTSTKPMDKLSTTKKSVKPSIKKKQLSDRHRYSNRDQERSERDDNRSTASTQSFASSRSTVSTNPDLDAIMKRTHVKAKKEIEKKVSRMSDRLPESSSESNDEMMNTMKYTSSDTKPKKKFSVTTEDMKFDKSIEDLLNRSDLYDDINKDDISIGSRDNKSVETKSLKSINSRQSQSSGRQSKNSGNNRMTLKPTTNALDFGTISIGSKTKGAKQTITIGGK